jgi:hypothetical protein
MMLLCTLGLAANSERPTKGEEERHGRKGVEATSEV